MCVTRAGRVLSKRGDNARVVLLDDGTQLDVDVSMVSVKKHSYVEVFAEQAIGRLTKKEAEFKRDLRLEVLRTRGEGA